jgi:hypothetical protein
MVPHKARLGLQNFPDNMIPNLLKKPYAPPKDKATGQPRAGEAPEIYWKCFKTGFGIMTEQTTFTGLDKKNYSWDMLKGVLLKYKPLFHVKCVYSGQGKSITIQLKSAIVIDVKNKSTMQYQNDTIDAYNAANPDDVKILQERMQKLILERKEATEAQLATGNQYPDGLAPANQTKDPLSAPSPQIQQPPQQQNYQQPPQQNYQQQNYQQPPVQQPQQNYQQPPVQQNYQPPQPPQQQNYQQPPAQNFQQHSPIASPQPPANALAQMQNFMQNQPTAPTLNLTAVPTIPGLITNPQFATPVTPGLTLQ